MRLLRFCLGESNLNDLILNLHRGCASDLPPNMMEPAANPSSLRQMKKYRKIHKSNLWKTGCIFGKPEKEVGNNHFRGKKTGSKSFSTLMFGVGKRVRC